MTWMCFKSVNLQKKIESKLTNSTQVNFVNVIFKYFCFTFRLWPVERESVKKWTSLINWRLEKMPGCQILIYHTFFNKQHCPLGQ